jgi:hypothetical protein
MLDEGALEPLDAERLAVVPGTTTSSADDCMPRSEAQSIGIAAGT